MSDDDIPASMAEAMAEIRRLREELEQLKALMLQQSKIMQTEYDAKDRRIAELEATHAVTLGTLEQPTDDAPFHLEHDVPPSTPR